MNTQVRKRSARRSLALALVLCPTTTAWVAEAVPAQRRPAPRAPGPAFRPPPAPRPSPARRAPLSHPPRAIQNQRWNRTPPPAAAIAAANRRVEESRAMVACGPQAATGAVSMTLATVPATAAEKERARKEARAFFTEVLPAKKTRPGVRQVTRLRWHKSLKQATKDAAKAGKPVLWIQALGDLKGYT